MDRSARPFVSESSLTEISLSLQQSKNVDAVLESSPQLWASGGVTDEANSSDEHQLSRDLALFLENPSLRAALADGSLDLASYSGQVEEELQQLETACIAVYRHKAAEIAFLKTELQECQSVLAALQEMLLGFRADLGGLSGEIRQLQERSRSLDVQLKNRRAAEQGLRHFLEHIVIAPNLVHVITTGRVNPAFLQCVEELNQIYKDANDGQPQTWSCDKPPAETIAGREMQLHASKLRLLAVARVRDYFLEQMSLLRQPQTNIRMIQVHGLLKFAALQDFLQDACPEIATEIFNVYVESMSKTLQQLFRTYQGQLLQLDATKSAATRHDVIAIEDSLLRDSLTTRAKKRVDVFCLGNRATECLQQYQGGESSRPILAHVALAENRRYPYEQLFRSVLGHLVDAVTNEHVFCRQFFKRDAFGPLFNMTLGVLLEQLENYLFGCYDALCLLLMIKVAHSYRRLAHDRKIHSLDPFLDQCTKLLWPRLKVVMEGHLRSLKQATAEKLGGVDLHAHYISRRFAEFCCSILLILQNKPPTAAMTTSTRRSGSGREEAKGQLTRQGKMAHAPAHDPADTQLSQSKRAAPSEATAQNKSAGDMLMDDLTEMTEEYITLLKRLSSEHSSQKRRTVFSINNLDQVVCIFQERRVIGKELNRFIELLLEQREAFVEEELLAGFSKMIAFVQQTEAHLAAPPRGPFDINVQVVEALVLDFASYWKIHIDQINRNVLSYFSNFRNGMEILKQVLTQLLLYYTRFQDIIRKVWRNKPPAFCKDLVPTTVILAEIKKYALAI